MAIQTEPAADAQEVTVEVQVAVESAGLPDRDRIAAWVRTALAGRSRRPVEVCVRLVDMPESADLNRRYRRKRGATNVLSFPFESPPGIPALPFLGDLVICAPVVEREAREQGKPRVAHWAHMVVHGTLHLAGYDHQTPAEAEAMESIETHLLGDLGFPDPYLARTASECAMTRNE